MRAANKPASMPAQELDTQRDADRQRFLAEASHLLSSTLDYTETLKRLARLAVPRIADWCAIFIADGHGQLEPVEVAHTDESKVEGIKEMRRRYPPNPSDQRGVYEVLRTGRSEFIRQVTDETFGERNMPPEQIQILRTLGISSAMTVPLRARGRTFGVIQFISADSGRLFDNEDVSFAEELAVRAAFAVDNARLFQTARKRQKEEAALRRATEAITATFSVDEIIQQIARSAVDATDADGSCVERMIDGEVVIVAVAGELHPEIGQRAPYEGSVAQRVVEFGQPEIIQSYGEHPAPLPGILADTLAFSSALFVPLVDGGEAIGALMLLRRETREPFTAEEAARAHTFGNLAALAFRKVHLLEDTERRREELEQVIQSRSRLMRGFTHDLKNPIGAADGHAALLQDGLLGELNDRQQNSVQRIRNSLRNALKLIEDLNEFARAESGKIELDMVPVQLIEIARELGEQYRDIAEQQGIMLDLELNKVPIITSDDDRIRQILGNLLSNAIKYTESGGRVIVRTDQRPNEVGDCVVLEVEDTGVGIPGDKLDELFEEFARINPGIKPGIGLGLAISRRVARALGGEITVHSKRNQGSTFTLWLPGH
jgi:signal transduction histidine kinase